MLTVQSTRQAASLLMETIMPKAHAALNVQKLLGIMAVRHVA